MPNIKPKFRKWYKGFHKILRLEQGDDNLIAVLFYNKSMHNYSVGVYTYRDGLFDLIQLNERIKNKSIALNKFRKIIEEF